ncbi:TVP38/TMEM64 family protein [Romboutsia weinsteinii]|uniref:TVP38/TMEM64 family membrane protein n=2 Tax=Romboutsia weinsteinii TaxID=2020949 RepID=A0A371J0Y9_9FIRM|nr:TVP38/TMEM64 family protein [Romboutsia weinsteinii]
MIINNISNRKKSINKPFWITSGILVLAVVLYLFIPSVNEIINKMTSYLVALDMEGLKQYILSFGVWAPIISFLLMILQSVAAPLPAFVITFANAALFGWVYGAILSWSSAMAGAALCFYIAKFLGRDVVENLTSKFAIKSVDEFFEKYGKHTILIARLLPFMSFDLVSYAAGLTSMGFVSFFVATGIGQLPATIVYSYVGGMLTGGAKLMMTGLLTLFALSILIYVVRRVWSENKR